jgi:hypothetical protein
MSFAEGCARIRPVTTPPVERRKHPRYLAAGRIAGHLIEQDMPVRVRDIGLGGFSIETMTPLEAGGEHRIRFVSSDEWSAVLTALVANCRPSCAEDGSPLFVAGLSFMPDDRPDTRRTVETLIEKVTSVQLYQH